MAFTAGAVVVLLVSSPLVADFWCFALVDNPFTWLEIGMTNHTRPSGDVHGRSWCKSWLRRNNPPDEGIDAAWTTSITNVPAEPGIQETR